MMPKPSIRESISAPRADAVAEIAAIGDDMHLRHRHRDAAGEAGDAEQRLQRVAARGRAARGVRAARRRAAPSRAHRRGRRSSKASGSMVTRQNRPMTIWVVPPAVGRDEMLHDRRPDRAGEVVAGGARCATAMPRRRVEPVRDVGDQRRRTSPSCRRRSDSPCASANCQRLGGRPAATIAEAERDARRPSTGTHDAEAVGEPAHGDAADAEADHGQRVGQGGRGAATPNSACTAGSATTTDHMPTPPMVPSSDRRAGAARRRAIRFGWREESACDSGAGGSMARRSRHFFPRGRNGRGATCNRSSDWRRGGASFESSEPRGALIRVFVENRLDRAHSMPWKYSPAVLPPG